MSLSDRDQASIDELLKALTHTQVPLTISIRMAVRGQS